MPPVREHECDPGTTAGSSSAVASASIKRACDQCRVRKVKCDGVTLCGPCEKSGLECTYLKPIMKKGPIPRWKREGERIPSPLRRRSRANSTPPRRSRRNSPSGFYAESAFLGALDERLYEPEPGQDGEAEPLDWLTNLDTPGPSDRGAFGGGPFAQHTPWDMGSVLPHVQPVLPPHIDPLTQPSHPTQSQSQHGIGSGESYTGPGTTDTVQTTESEDLLAAGAIGQLLQPRPVDQNIDSFTGIPMVASGLDDTDEPDPFYQALTERLPLALQTFPSSSLMTQAAPAPAPDEDFRFLSSVPPPPNPWSLPFTPPEILSPLLTLTLDTLIIPQLETFFARVYPMIPIFTRSYVFDRIHNPSFQADNSFVSLIFAMCSLSVIHPLEPNEMAQRPNRVKQAKVFMDESCKLRAKWDYGSPPSSEGVMTSYLMFGTLFELGFGDMAKMRLREAISMGEVLRLNDARSYQFLERDEASRRLRMFWVLAITERAYALQRSGSIVFEGSLSAAPVMQIGSSPDGPSLSLKYLARIFNFLDGDIIACWNGRCLRSACKTLTPERTVYILSRLSGTTAEVFGDEDGLHQLSEVQKADLLVTWQWIRNRIWHLAHLHGLTGEDRAKELGFGYPVEVALTTVAICKRLSIPSMEAHGTGFVEKLYDIASTVTELLQSRHPLTGKLASMARTNQWTELLQNLYLFVSRHRAGDTFSISLAQAVAAVPKGRLRLTQG